MIHLQTKIIQGYTKAIKKLWEEVRRLQNAQGRTLADPIVIEGDNEVKEEGSQVVTKLILLDDD